MSVQTVPDMGKKQLRLLVLLHEAEALACKASASVSLFKELEASASASALPAELLLQLLLHNQSFSYRERRWVVESIADQYGAFLPIRSFLH